MLHIDILQSKTHVVLATLRRSPDEMSSHQLKMFKVDDHLGIAISGLNSDGRSLSRYMRTETLNHRSDMHQHCFQTIPAHVSCLAEIPHCVCLSSLARHQHVLTAAALQSVLTQQSSVILVPPFAMFTLVPDIAGVDSTVHRCSVAFTRTHVRLHIGSQQ